MNSLIVCLSINRLILGIHLLVKFAHEASLVIMMMMTVTTPHSRKGTCCEVAGYEMMLRRTGKERR